MATLFRKDTVQVQPKERRWGGGRWGFKRGRERKRKSELARRKGEREREAGEGTCTSKEFGHDNIDTVGPGD